ncbi:MAG TPA: hypothetical protein VFB92_14845 [Vicinamibacterales bacterium]|nr:hypothetical protein [Vicinamibacterales bacterium]
MRPMILAALLALSTPLLGQAPASSLQLNFTPSADDFRAATEEYRGIWAREGRRIVEAMERATGFRFEPGPIEVSIYEGTSYSGERGGRPMLLRASYAEETKRGTLVHELAHRLAADVPFKGDHHELIFLFVYDVWVDLWGQEFADGQVRIEGLRKGIVDYDGIWKRTLAIPAEERARRLKEILGRSRTQ